MQLCKAGLKTLQDLGPEMRLALNEDLEEDEEEEEAILDEEGLEENTVYKVWSYISVSDYVNKYLGRAE